MKIKIFLLIFVVGFIFVGVSYSYADHEKKPSPQEDPSLIDVSLQLQLRNSDGQLITYIEPTTMYIQNIKLVHEFLDTKENKKIIEKENERFQVIEYKQTWVLPQTKAVTTVSMWYEGDTVLLFRMDGFVTAPGDILYASWKIIRTIQ